MIRTLQSELAELIRSAALEKFGQAPEKIAFSRPPKIEMGDLACPCALELAKRLGKKPREVASELQAALAGKHPWVEKIELAGPGYLNVFLDRLKICAALAGRELPIERHATRGKVIVEHTNINPNKAAHIGHVRNSVLGDTLARALRALGESVEVQNYIDDTGVQVADVVVGLLYKENQSAAAAIAWIANDPRNLDKRCWDLYAATTKWYEADKAREQFRRDTLHAIEKDEGDAAAVARALVPAILRCHLATMGRLGIHYDVLTHESTIIHLGFFQDAFERMKKSGAIHLAAEGKNKDCWVMRLQDDPEFKNLEDPDKVIVRSNGTVTYIGKDIANQMWKLGLLGKDFAYGMFVDFDGRKIYQTRETAESGVEQKQFGHGQMAINVIDNRQSYLQKIVAEGLRRLGHPEAAINSIHFNYEMVGLTPQTAEDLGATLTEEDRNKKFIEMSGRSGLGMKADDLLDLSIHKPLLSMIFKFDNSEKLDKSTEFLVDMCMKMTHTLHDIFKKSPSELDHYSFKHIKYNLARLGSTYYDNPNSEPSPEAIHDFIDVYNQINLIIDRGNSKIVPPQIMTELVDRSYYNRALTIAVAALRYYVIRFNKDQIIAFDANLATDVKGETGPYLLYAVVRARNILRKYGEATGLDDDAVAEEIKSWPAETFAGLEPEAASLLMDLLETPRVLDAAVNSLELSLLARHFYLLAQGFNNYYHKYPVIKEGVSDADKKRRLKFVQLFERHFKTGLETILGIPVPERM